MGQKFKESKDGYFNQRLEAVRQNQLDYRKKQSESGKKGAEKRWQKDSDATGDPNSSGNGEPNGQSDGQNIALRSPVSGLRTPDSTNLPTKEKNEVVLSISTGEIREVTQ